MQHTNHDEIIRNLEAALSVTEDHQTARHIRAALERTRWLQALDALPEAPAQP